MVRRKIRDAHEARSCLAEAEESGSPLAAWARRNGIDGRSLNAWRLNLARKSSGVADRSQIIATHYEGPFRFFVCACGHDQAINENMTWCAKCRVEYDITKTGVRLVPDRKTPRFAVAKAWNAMGGMSMGKLKHTPDED